MVRVREASNAMFGNSFRLEVLAMVGEFDEAFYAHEIARRIDVADNVVSAELDELHEVGLLLARRSTTPEVIYSARKSSIWAAAKRLRDELASAERPTDERSATSASAFRSLGVSPASSPTSLPNPPEPPRLEDHYPQAGSLPASVR